MLMIELRDYVTLHGRTSLQDLARHFRLNESAIESMMNVWIKKGRIAQLTATASNCNTTKCSDCFGCNDSVRRLYISVSDEQVITLN